jgi:hypothetical protein
MSAAEQATHVRQDHMNPRRAFRRLTRAWRRYWADYGRGILRPFEWEGGAGGLPPVFDRTISVYLFAIAVAGCAFVFLLPPFMGTDEPWHWLRAVQIAGGEFFPRDMGLNRWGGHVDRGAYVFIESILQAFRSKAPIPVAEVRQILQSFPAGSSEMVAVAFPPAAYSPLPYLPSAIGIALARLFGADLLQQVWAARLGNLLVYLIGVVGVIKLLPRGRYAALALCTTPAAIQLAGSISGDPANFIIPALLIALCLRVQVDAKWPAPAGKPALALLIISLGLLKPTTMMLAGLSLMIPAQQFGGSREKWRFLLKVALAAAAVAIAWNMAYPLVPAAYWDIGANPGETLATIFGDPFAALRTFFGTVWDKSPLWWMESYGRFGGHPSPYSHYTPSILDWIGLGLILALIPTSRNPRFDPIGAAYLLLAAFALATLILLALWLGFTRPGSPSILGLQGRYFFPSELMWVLAIAAVVPVGFAVTWLRSPLLLAALACHLATVFLALEYFQFGWPVSAIAEVYASRPANDDFSNPATIQAGELLSGTNAGATNEKGEPVHAGNAGGHSVWWRFTAPVDGPVTLSAAGSDFDTLLAVYTGAALESLSLIASNDDVQREGVLVGASELTFDAKKGTSYLIAVDGHHGETGRVILGVSGAAGATRLYASVWPGSATLAAGEPLHALASVINGGSVAALGCTIRLPDGVPAAIGYQISDPATNIPIGRPNTAVDIGAKQTQTFVLSITAKEAFAGDMGPVFDCKNTAPVAGTIQVKAVEAKPRQ